MSQGEQRPDDRPPLEPERRSLGEWVVVAVLVALIIAVAWGQFGSLFEDAPASPEADIRTERTHE